MDKLSHELLCTERSKGSMITGYVMRTAGGDVRVIAKGGQVVDIKSRHWQTFMDSAGAVSLAKLNVRVEIENLDEVKDLQARIKVWSELPFYKKCWRLLFARSMATLLV